MNGTTKRALKAALFLLLLIAGCAFVILVWRPSCPIAALTGLACPGCGGQRMLWALFRGDFPAALRHNALLLFLLPAVIVYALWEAVRYARGFPPLYQKRAAVIALAAVLITTVVFTVLRNLPGVDVLGPY